MEPLPTQGQTLRHYTALRPRPRRTRTQPPSSRPQELKAEAENEASEGMGRVDEGVEEFFTKKIIPDYALKGRWEESNPAQATPSESSFTSLAPLPLSPSSDSVPPCPESTTVSSAPDPSTDTQSRARAGKNAKAAGGEGGGESVKVKRTSIADLIRPLREAKDRERERYKERGAKSVDDVNVCNDAAITEGSAAVGMRLAGEGMDVLMPVKTLTITTPSNESAPTHPTTPVPSASTHMDHTESTGSQPDHPPEVRPEGTEQGDTKTSVERALRTKRSLREGKSQSLILLTGDEDRAHKKKNSQESTNSFEQRLQVMLHRISVGRSPPPDTKMNQNKEDELRKANSEGAILDKPDSPSYVKPRTMSTSAAERRDPKKAPDPVRPLLHPKPPVPERPLLPKPPVSAKPILQVPATGGTGKIRSLSEDGKAVDTPAQIENQESTKGPPPATLPKTELCSPALRKIPSTVDRSEKAQSITDGSLPQPRPHLKPPTQRRAVSVHEDTLAMTQELKAVLQRSPIRLCGNKGELPTCIEDSTAGEEAQSPQDEAEKQECERQQTGVGAKPKFQEKEDSSCVSSATQGQKEKSKLPHTPVSPPPQDKSPTPALSKTAEKLQKSPHSQEKLSILASSEISKGAHVSPTSDAKKSPSMPIGERERQAEDVSKQHTSNSASGL
ncbi:capping protein, Arp2/3 and myosin-I linker protein 2 [Boleophthalmus pectinirostris]|uniref:capping protein, Arp2/3 and myosin-I linker protein 2 n=1 Tax=Boleophthalmus pectinirostris TaxID=150288 RepID=UPI00242C80BC|nr:capping protein, Arp2/3 and myosin-I linker protein 2 [Boleophthalmus pectinirostris]